jgi:hypothetical protein
VPMAYTSLILPWAITWRNKMKKFALAAAFAGAGSTAFAGNMAEPVMEETAGSSSSAGLIIPLILVVLIAAALAD